MVILLDEILLLHTENQGQLKLIFQTCLQQYFNTFL